MSEKIEPALSADEWFVPQIARPHLYCLSEERVGLSFGDGSVAPRTGIDVEIEDVPAIIALANAALRDSDRRKITREWINELRYAADTLKPIAYLAATPQPTERDRELMDTSTVLSVIADALASYLPPEAG